MTYTSFFYIFQHDTLSEHKAPDSISLQTRTNREKNQQNEKHSNVCHRGCEPIEGEMRAYQAGFPEVTARSDSGHIHNKFLLLAVEIKFGS